MKQDASRRRVLIVDDTPSIHETIRSVLGGGPTSGGDLDDLEAELFGESPSQAKASPLTYDLDSAYQGEEGIGLVERALREGKPYSLAIVDMRMPPGLDGLETIERLWEVDPTLQVVICTAYSDRSWSEIHERLQGRDRLLVLKKPFDAIELAQITEAMTAKVAATRAERALLRDTVGGMITVMNDLLALVTPSAAQRTQWLRACVAHQVRSLKLRHWAYELAAGVSQIGCMTLPAETVATERDGHPLGDTEAKAFARHPGTAARIVAKVPRMSIVARIVAHQHDPKPARFDAPNEDDDTWVIAAGSQLLHASLVFDTALRRTKTREDALALCQASSCDPAVLEVLSTFRPPVQARWRTTELPLSEVRAGMVFAEDVIASNGMLFCPGDTKVTEAMVERLSNFASRIDERILYSVRVPTALFPEKPAEPAA